MRGGWIGVAILFVMLVAIGIITSCAGKPLPAESTQSEHSARVLMNYQQPSPGLDRIIMVEVDGCQYVLTSYHSNGVALAMVHKANCPNHTYLSDYPRPKEVK